jgi:hypothetical protein
MTTDLRRHPPARTISDRAKLFVDQALCDRFVSAPGEAQRVSWEPMVDCNYVTIGTVRFAVRVEPVDV